MRNLLFLLTAAATWLGLIHSSPAQSSPMGADNVVTFGVDSSAILTDAEFGFHYADGTTPYTFSGVKITTLPAVGTLALGGVAVNAGDIIPVAALSQETAWTPRDSSRMWDSVASSADGSHLVAVVRGGQIYTSTDAGVSWTPREESRNWQAVASSADGVNLVAVVYDGQIYTSSDAGVNWIPRDQSRSWFAVASSADGTHLLAAESDEEDETYGQLYTSSDSGVNWTAREEYRQWSAVASSADGTRLVAVEDGGQIHTSTDAGVNWTAREQNRTWSAVASSADGNKLVATVFFGMIYTSIDAGVSWTPHEQDREWISVASSADGDRLVAVESGGQIYTSSDAGVSWTVQEQYRGWVSVASSADGSRLAAVLGSGQVYTSPPRLVFTPAAGGAGPGYASFAFQVQDSGGQTDSASHTITFNVDHFPVVAIAAPSPILPNTSAGFTFTATDSDPGDQAAGFTWQIDFGDGTPTVQQAAGTASPVAIAHSFATSGPYPVTVTVTDAEGGVTIWDQVVAVDYLPTLAVAAPPFAGVDRAFTLTLTATDVDASDQSAGFSYTVDFADGSDVVTLPAGTASPVQVPHTYTQAGSYTAVATVTDQQGGVSASVSTVIPVRVEHAPSGTDGSLAIAAGGTAFLTPSAFGFSDPGDVPPNAFIGVKITALPAQGVLSLNGTPVQAGDFVPYDALLAGEVWTPREQARYWQEVACSADGSKLVAAGYNEQIYTSGDAGATWTPRDQGRAWQAVASSADGTKLVAVVYDGQIYTSSDSGATWIPREQSRQWQSVASSADGSKLVAVVNGGQIYTSSDAGVTWTPQDQSRQWECVASSADGSELVAAAYYGQIYTSSDSGVTWIPREQSRSWVAMASSADGSHLVAAAQSGQLYTSSDSGVTWIPRDQTRQWTCVASSADGNKLVAAEYSGQIYISSNAGVTWAPEEQQRRWSGVASSADAGKLVAVAVYEQIYTSTPILAFTPVADTGSGYGALSFQVEDDGEVPLDPTPNTLAFVSAAAQLAVAAPVGHALATGATVDFGSAGLKVAVPVSFQLSNPGGLDLRVTPTLTGPNAAIFLVPGAPVIVPAQGTVTLTVQAVPASLGAETATLHLTTDDLGQPDFTVALTANGLAAVAPTVITQPASGVGTALATLNGSVNAQNSPRTVEFDYGTTVRYGATVTATPGTLATATATPVSAALTGLAPHTLYHFRVRAEGIMGAALGRDSTFTTGNSKPVAADDNFGVTPAATLLDVLANDTGADGGDVLTVVSKTALSPATAGTLKLSKGALVFTPSASFSTASFQYTIRDHTGATSTATVHLSPTTLSLLTGAQAVPAIGGRYLISLHTTGAWSASNPLSWVSLSATSGTGGLYIYATVQPNPTKNTRSGTIKFGDQSYIVTQSGDAKPVIGPVNASYGAAVGAPFSLAIPTTNRPVAYTARNLPPGLTLDKATGLISGTPLVAGHYAVTVTAKNGAGAADAALSLAIQVAPVPASAIGTYQGLIDRDRVLNGDVASSFVLTTTSKGAFTLKLTTGRTAFAFKGALSTSGAEPALSLPIPALGATLALQFDPATGGADGTLSDGGTHTAGAHGWRSAAIVTNGGAAEFAGLHTFFLQQPDPAASLPQGYGYGSFKVSASSGLLRVIGKLADGAAFSSGTSVGEGGQVLVYSPLYNYLGSVAGNLSMTPGGTPPASNRLNGIVTWAKPVLPATSKDKAYVQGFLPLPLIAAGGTYTAPAPGGRALDAAVATGSTPNATLSFSGPSTFNQNVQITNPKPTGLTNLAQTILGANSVKLPTLTATTGAFAGSFTLPPANSAPGRPVSFSGQIVTTDESTQGYGFFLLPEVPATGETLATSPRDSGAVLFHAP